MEINASKLARGLVIRKTKRVIDKVMDGLGPKAIGFLLEKDRDLKMYLPEEAAAQWKLALGGFKWAGNYIQEDDDFYAMLPEWTKTMIAAKGETGKSWFKRQTDWLRSFLT